MCPCCILIQGGATCSVGGRGVVCNNVPKLTPLWGPASIWNPHTTVLLHTKLVCSFVKTWLFKAFSRLPLALTATGLSPKIWSFSRRISLWENWLPALPEPVWCPRLPAMTWRTCILSRDPVAAWCLLWVRAAELGLVDQCTSLWHLLCALASVMHREDSCVALELVLTG
jgi:hypothetical protein